MVPQPSGEIAAEFNGLGGICYLNAAGEGPLPGRSARALAKAVAVKSRPESIGRAEYRDLPASLRERIARLINASPDEIALTGSTSAGIGLAARELRLSPGDEILLLEGQFPANVLPWKAAEARGATLRRAPLPRGASPFHAVKDALTSRTAIVSVDWVGYATGARAEITDIGSLCRNRGVVFVLDAAQGAGALRLDVCRDPVDVVAAPGHKWMLGPQGTGFLWVRKEVLESIHPYNAGWLNLAFTHGFQSLSAMPEEPPRDATRLESGTPPVILLTAWRESLDLLLEIGPREVERRVLENAALAREACRSAGLTVTSPESTPLESQIVTAAAGEATMAVYRSLLNERVITAVREGHLRISAHVYNTSADLERFGAVAGDALAGRSGGSSRSGPIGGGSARH